MDGEIRLPPDGTGKRLDTSQLSFAGSPRQRQRISVADSENPTGIVAVTNRAMDVNVVSGGLLPLSQPLSAQTPTPRAVVDGAIVLPPDSNGKRLDTSQVTVSGDLVQRQRMVIGDPTNPNGLATVAGGALNVNIAGLGGTPLSISLTPTDGDVLTYDATGGVTGGKWIAKAPAVTTPPDLSGLLPLAGGTMTGPIVLPADPTNALEATTKRYVDDEIANAGGAVDLTGYVQKAGSTMTGALVLHADPTAALEAATKDYVDTEIASAVTGGTVDLTAYVQKAGSTMTGALVLHADPANDMEAATKKYVDDELTAIDLTGYLPTTGKAADSSLLNGKADTAFATAAQGALADSALQSAALTPLTDRLDDIEGVIPTQATTTNQLADKDFVNSAVAAMAANQVTKTALGDVMWTSLAEIQAGPWFVNGVSHTPAQNDYAIYDDGTEQWRAKYTGTQWQNDFRIGSSLTSTQQAALDSGITATIVTSIGDKLDKAGGTMTGALVLHADPAANLEAATKQYVDTGIADQVAAAQYWLPAVELQANLPTVTDTTKTYLCRVRSENNVYQCVAGQAAWLLYSVNTDFLPLNGKAADSALLNGMAETEFVDISSIQTIGGTKTFDDPAIFNDTVTLHDNAEIDGNLEVKGSADFFDPVIIHDYIDVPAPTSDLHPATKKYVDDNFVEEAPNDGKLYGRKDEDWEEIPAAATGSYLPLTGGTITGPLTLNGNLWVQGDDIHCETAGTVWLESSSEDVRVQSKFTVNGPAAFNSTLTLAGDPTQNYQAATKKYVDDRPAGSGLPLTGGTLTGDLTAPRIATTQGATLDGSSIRIGSASAGSVILQSSAGIHFASATTFTDSTFAGKMTLTGSVERLGPDSVPVLEITAGNNPRILLGSSNYQNCEIGVYGKIWSNETGLSRVYESGSGIFLTSYGQPGYSFDGTIGLTGPNNRARIYRMGPDGIPTFDLWWDHLSNPHMQIGSSNYSGGTTQIWGKTSANMEWLTVSGGAYIQGSAFYVHSTGSAISISCPNGVYLDGGNAGVNVQQFNCNGPATFNYPVELKNRLFRMGPDSYPVIDITAGNTPTVTLGSSNYNAHLIVSGKLSCSSIEGSFRSWDGNDVVSVGSGIQIWSQYATIYMGQKTQLDGVVDCKARFCRTHSASSAVTVWDFPTGNEPACTIGSTQFYNASLHVYGQLSAYYINGTWNAYPGSGENTYMYLGSGAYFYSQIYSFNIDADLNVHRQAYKAGGGPWQTWSDRRLKSDTEPYTDGLEKLTQLKPIKFRYNDRARLAETGRQYVGLAAEEVQEVMPSMVGHTQTKIDYEDKEATDVLTIDAGELIYTVINALKQIDKRLQKLEDKVK